MPDGRSARGDRDAFVLEMILFAIMIDAKSRIFRILVVLVAVAALGSVVGQSATLYSSTGQAVAYIDWGDDATIFMWDGTPVAYLHSDGSRNYWLVYAYSGSFLGWYEGGVIWDLQGNGIVAEASVLTRPPSPEPVKSAKKPKPFRGFRAFVPFKPLFTYRFSSQTAAGFFGVSAGSTATARRSSGASAVPGRYSGTGRSQNISSVTVTGEIMTLLDGSRWEIYILDQVNASIWIPGTRVTVETASRATLGYEYIIRNNFGREIRARFLGY